MLKKTKKVVVFGLLDTALLAQHYLTHDSEYEVVAFTANSSYMKEPFLNGLPVVAFEEVETLYSPDDYYFFAPMTGRRMNTDRESIYNQAKAKGYRFITYVNSKACTFDSQIGENCFILENCTVQLFATVADNVVLWTGAMVGHHCTIKPHVFGAPNSVFLGHTVIESYCFVGANSTIREYTTLAQGTMVAMGSVVVSNTEAWGMYKGNPARKRENMRSIEHY